MVKKIILLLGMLYLLMFAIWFVFSNRFVSGDFRNNLWAPANLLVQGQSPYHIALLFPGVTAVWFPQVIGLFYPLGFLSQSIASNLWMLLNGLVLIALVWSLLKQVRQKNAPPLLFGLVLFGVLFFPSSLVHFSLGQVDFLLISALMLASVAIERRNAPLAALCFAFALTKPQICLLVIPAVFISLAWNRQWKFGLILSLWTLAIAFLFTLPLWVLYPAWVGDFILNLRSLPKWWQPSLFSQLETGLGRLGIVLWSLVAAASLGMTTLLRRKLPPHRAILWGLGLTTLAAPYLWSWDFTLLLPLFIDTAGRLMKTSSRLVLTCSWALSLLISIGSYRFDDGDKRLWFLPLLILSGIGISLFLEDKYNR